MKWLIGLIRKRCKQWGEIYRRDKVGFFIYWSIPFIVGSLVWLITKWLAE